jgi:hypothetical protein
MVYVIQVCRQLSSRIRMELQFHPDPASRKLPVWHTPLLRVQWITPDDGQRYCPKHVEFHFQNKSEKLVHLFGFIIRKFVTVHGHMNVKKNILWFRLFFIRLRKFVCHIRGRTKAEGVKNRVLRRGLGPNKGEVTQGWRKLRNEELHDLYPSPNIRLDQIK